MLFEWNGTCHFRCMQPFTYKGVGAGSEMSSHSSCPHQRCITVFRHARNLPYLQRPHVEAAMPSPTSYPLSLATFKVRPAPPLLSMPVPRSSLAQRSSHSSPRTSSNLTSWLTLLSTHLVTCECSNPDESTAPG